MDKEVVIQVENLSKKYKLYDNPVHRLKESINPFGKKYHTEFHAIKDLNFTIHTGEMIGIIGKNGSGKSTLLKMLTGVLTPTTGKMSINGRVSALLELGAGFNPDFTGMENIYFHGTIMGYTKEDMDSKVDEILEFADIGQFIDQPVKMYSSGMFVRLAFAVAIAIEPEILIIDEALAVGDLRFQQKAIRKMKELMHKSKAILFVSHDMRSIRTFCSRVLWLSEGKLFKSGDSKEIARMYEDYMIHDILPEGDNKTDVIVPAQKFVKKESGNKQSLEEQKLVWADLASYNSLGGIHARFEKISICLPEGKDNNELDGNEQITIYAMLNVHTDLETPLIGFGIFNDKGVPIVHFNTQTIPYKQQPFAGNSEICIKYQLQLPNLRNGAYFVSIGLDNGEIGCHEVVHRVNDCYCFKVSRQDYFAEQHGNIIVEDARINIV